MCGQQFECIAKYVEGMAGAIERQVAAMEAVAAATLEMSAAAQDFGHAYADAAVATVAGTVGGVQRLVHGASQGEVVGHFGRALATYRDLARLCAQHRALRAAASTAHAHLSDGDDAEGEARFTAAATAVERDHARLCDRLAAGVLAECSHYIEASRRHYEECAAVVGPLVQVAAQWDQTAAEARARLAEPPSTPSPQQQLSSPLAAGAASAAPEACPSPTAVPRSPGGQTRAARAWVTAVVPSGGAGERTTTRGRSLSAMGAELAGAEGVPDDKQGQQQGQQGQQGQQEQQQGDALFAEFVRAEQRLVGSLGVIVDTFVESVMCNANLMESIGKASINLMFSGMHPLLELHTALLRRLSAPAALAAAFDRATVARVCAVHARYSASVAVSLATLRACRKSSKAFAGITAAVESRAAAAHAQTLEDLYLLPLARVGDYTAFFAQAAAGDVAAVPPADRAYLARVGATLLDTAAQADAVLAAVRVRAVQDRIGGWDGAGGCAPQTRRFVARFAVTAAAGPAAGSGELYFFSDVVVHARRRGGGRRPAQFVRAYSLPVLTLRALPDDAAHRHANALECVDFSTGARAVFCFATPAARRTALACAEAYVRELDRSEVFGVALAPLMRAPQQRGRALPALLADTAAVLRAPPAVAQEGLFRLSPSKRALDELRRRIDLGERPDYAALPAHTVAGLLKLWLRALPEPLCTAARCADFQAAVPPRPAPSMMASATAAGPSAGASASEDASEDSEEAVAQGVARLRKVVQTLPALNRRCLRCVLELLACVAAHAAENRMDAANLSVVFTPLLLRDGAAEAAAAEAAAGAAGDGAVPGVAAMRAMAAMNFECVAFMIAHCDAVFRGTDADAGSSDGDADGDVPQCLELDPLTPEEARALDAQFPALAVARSQAQ